MFLFYSSCLLMVSFITGFSSESYGGLNHHDHVYCYINSSKCVAYVNQTLTFVCKCVKQDCVTRWVLNGNSSAEKSVNGVDYTVKVTNGTAGTMICYNDRSPEHYVWDTTVKQPKPPKFVQTPQNQHFNPEVINIGDGNPTCEICVNCTVTGDPPPIVTWEYQHGNMLKFSSVVTNQSNASSPYYIQDNGQKLCFNDIRRYYLVDDTNYQCTAANVGGSTYGSFSTTVNAYPFPQPGPSATRGSVFLEAQNVTLIMDTVYYVISFFQVCLYNRSIPTTLISCCSCYSTCEWGELSGHTDADTKSVSCQLTTSRPGLYQFQIQTSNYPCFFNIGDPIDVNDINNNSSVSDNQFKFTFQFLSYVLGGLCLLLVIGIIVTFCGTRKYYVRRQYARLDGDVQNAEAEIPASCPPAGDLTAASNCNDKYSTETTPLLTSTNEAVASKPSAQNGGKTEHVHGRMKATIDDSSYTIDRSIETTNKDRRSVSNSSEISEELFPIDRANKTARPSHAQGKTVELKEPNDYSVMHIGSNHNIGNVKSFFSNQTDSEAPANDTVYSSSPIKDTNDVVPMLCPNQETQARKVVYITHYSDSEKWITNTLKPILDKLNVDILTIEDAVVGQTMATARDELVNKADIIIVVFSLQSKQNKKSLESKWVHYDLDRANHKNPDPNKIRFIPILFGDTERKDLPRPLDNVVVLKADNTSLEEKIKESIFRKL